MPGRAARIGPRHSAAASYDAAILGWISTGVGVGRVPQIFRTGAGSNFNGYSDADADKDDGTAVHHH